MTSFYFVIDTENYAGNFERQMCAYATGQIGHCGVGEEEQGLFGEDEDIDKFDDLITLEPDEHGCSRPVKIYLTPGWFNNGVGGHYNESEPGVLERAQIEHDASVRDYAENSIRRCYDHMPDYAEERAAQYIKDNVGKPLRKYPAYMSVAICLNREPTQEESDQIKVRAQKFANEHKNFDGASDPITITGFRLVIERMVAESKAL